MKKEQSNSGLLNNEIIELTANLKNVKQVLLSKPYCKHYSLLTVSQLLVSAESHLHRSQSFQGGFCEVYKEDSPLAGILATVSGVRMTS